MLRYSVCYISNTRKHGQKKKNCLRCKVTTEQLSAESGKMEKEIFEILILFRL